MFTKARKKQNLFYFFNCGLKECIHGSLAVKLTAIYINNNTMILY